jgi:hypothetical protein
MVSGVILAQRCIDGLCDVSWGILDVVTVPEHDSQSSPDEYDACQAKRVQWLARLGAAMAT